MGGNSPFQGVQEMAFDAILALYGEPEVTWKKAGGDVKDTALFNDPTNPERYQLIGGRGLSHVGYNNSDVLRAYIEYREGQFVGLFDLVYGQDVNQYIEVDGVRYVATKTATFFDGQTYKVYLDKAETEAVLEQ